MDRIEQYRQFIFDFYKAINGEIKTIELLSQFTSDPKLIEHLLSLEELLPKFKLIPEEITSEQNRVIVKAFLKGWQSGKTGNKKTRTNSVTTTFVTGYIIENRKIVSHWFITDQMELMKQIGSNNH